MTYFILSEVKTPMYENQPVAVEDYIVGIYPTKDAAKDALDAIVGTYKELTIEEEALVRTHYRFVEFDQLCL